MTLVFLLFFVLFFVFVAAEALNTHDLHYLPVWDDDDGR